jgi:hypothetical protein
MKHTVYKGPWWECAGMLSCPHKPCLAASMLTWSFVTRPLPPAAVCPAQGAARHQGSAPPAGPGGGAAPLRHWRPAGTVGDAGGHQGPAIGSGQEGHPTLPAVGNDTKVGLPPGM